MVLEEFAELLVVAAIVLDVADILDVVLLLEFGVLDTADVVGVGEP